MKEQRGDYESSDLRPEITPEFITKKREEKGEIEKYSTVFFDDEREWARFLDHIYDEYGRPWGLEFSGVALPMSIRVTPELLEKVYDQFAMKLVVAQDVREFLATRKGDHPFDPRSLEGLHVPGIGFFKPRPRRERW